MSNSNINTQTHLPKKSWVWVWVVGESEGNLEKTSLRYKIYFF